MRSGLDVKWQFRLILVGQITKTILETIDIMALDLEEWERQTSRCSVHNIHFDGETQYLIR